MFWAWRQLSSKQDITVVRGPPEPDSCQLVLAAAKGLGSTQSLSNICNLGTNRPASLPSTCKAPINKVASHISAWIGKNLHFLYNWNGRPSVSLFLLWPIAHPSTTPHSLTKSLQESVSQLAIPLLIQNILNSCLFTISSVWYIKFQFWLILFLFQDVNAEVSVSRQTSKLLPLLTSNCQFSGLSTVWSHSANATTVLNHEIGKLCF